MKKSMPALCAILLAFSAFAAGPDEETYGERVWFLADGNFATGNYLDYFQRPFAGEQKRNLEGYKGYLCRVHYGDTRPMKVEPGKQYRISFKMFNEGARNETTNRVETAFMPTAIHFLKGGDDYNEAWKSVKSLTSFRRGPGSEILEMKVPGPEWTEVKREFTVPEGCSMVTFTFAYSRGTNWGPFLLAEMKLEEIK